MHGVFKWHIGDIARTTVFVNTPLESDFLVVIDRVSRRKRDGEPIYDVKVLGRVRAKAGKKGFEVFYGGDDLPIMLSTVYNWGLAPIDIIF